MVKQKANVVAPVIVVAAAAVVLGIWALKFNIVTAEFVSYSHLWV